MSVSDVCMCLLKQIDFLSLVQSIFFNAVAKLNSDSVKVYTHTHTQKWCELNCQSYFVPIISPCKHTSIQLTSVLIGIQCQKVGVGDRRCKSQRVMSLFYFSPTFSDV